MLDHNYKFKTTKYQQIWDNELKNINQNIKLIYQDRIDLQVILTNFRKVFKITPAKIKTLKADDENIKLIVSIALKYTSITTDTLTAELNIDKNDIDNILKYDSTIFSKKVDDFFEPLKDDYLANKKAVLSMQENIL
jgi:septum formation topological specificity factor MinE